jgi:hypothetical protein
MSRVIPRSLILVGAFALSFAPLAIVTPAGASARSGTAITLFSGDTSFSADGHNWSLSINAFNKVASIELTTTDEDDSWTFLSVPAKDLNANSKTGHAIFKSRNSLAPIASISLNFTATGEKKQACESGSEMVFTGHISGSVTLVASSKVKFTSAQVKFSSPFLDFNHTCVAKTSGGANACFGGFWRAGSTIPAIGDTPGLASEALTVSISKRVVPKAPKNVILTSDVFGSESKPVFNSKKKTLSVKASGGLIAGSALLTSKELPSVQTSTCISKGKKFKASDAEYLGKYASPSGHQLTGQSAILGKLTLAKTGSAIFDIITFKKA